MKKILGVFLVVLAMCGGIVSFAPVGAWAVEEEADNGCIETNIFGQYCDDGSGGGVYMVLNLVLTVLTFGVGIAATIGLVMSAIMYLTAKDNESQVAKAKTRIFEIVIGLLVWAMMYAALKWLIPGFN